MSAVFDNDEITKLYNATYEDLIFGLKKVLPTLNEVERDKFISALELAITFQLTENPDLTVSEAFLSLYHMGFESFGYVNMLSEGR